MSEDREHRIPLRMMEVMLEEMHGWMNDLLRDTLDPEKIMGFIEAMGFNVSQFPGAMQNQSGLNPYQVLGLDKSASDEEIKHRYRELLRKLHPDTAGTRGTEFLFTLVMAAYKQISRERGWS